MYTDFPVLFQLHSGGFLRILVPFLWIPVDSGPIPVDSCRNGKGTVKYWYLSVQGTNALHKAVKTLSDVRHSKASPSGARRSNLISVEQTIFRQF
jgi:hypothetical protein